jgi:hypothetical protein
MVAAWVGASLPVSSEDTVMSKATLGASGNPTSIVASLDVRPSLSVVK